MASIIKNFKLIDEKIFIKSHILGQGNFAKVYLSTLKEDESQQYACKLINKESIK